MTHEQHHIRRFDGVLDAFELVGVERCPTTHGCAALHVPHLCPSAERCCSCSGPCGLPVGGSGPRAQAQLMIRDGLGLAHQVESKKPGRQRQLGRLHNDSGRAGGLMTAAPALIALVAPAVDQPVLLALTVGATETIRPA